MSSRLTGHLDPKKKPNHPTTCLPKTTAFSPRRAPAAGAIIQLGEGASFAISQQWPDAPEWLYGRHGTAAMLFFTVVIIFPLSMLPNMRKVGAR